MRKIAYERDNVAIESRNIEQNTASKATEIHDNDHYDNGHDGEGL